MGKKKSKSSSANVLSSSITSSLLDKETDSNALIIDPVEQAKKKKLLKELHLASMTPKMNPKKKKRLEKYIEKKLKKEERVERLERLGASSFKSDLLISSKDLGRGTASKKEKLKRNLMETRLGLPVSYKDVEVLQEKDPMIVEVSVAEPMTLSSSESESSELEESLEDDNASMLTLKDLKKREDEPKKVSVKEAFTPQPPKESFPELFQRLLENGSKKFHVIPNRKPEIQEKRLQLPVCGEEQEIMEKILENDTVVLCGETGSGKTTQVPQFLYEAGFGHPGSLYPGRIAVTQPRRVAAVSMAKRVAEELNVTSKIVSHHIRYDSTVSDSSVISFMTDGVLLREMASDFCLSKYSCVIIDEAHERSLNTDILLGMLSRIVKLRREMFDNKEASASSPLKLIIMSATLRVEDFVQNQMLFSDPPPLIHIKARQYPVTMHFNRKTPTDYVSEAFKKICKIHSRLPEGGILVFLSGQNEIHALARKLRSKFPPKSSAGLKCWRQVEDSIEDSNLSEDREKLSVENLSAAEIMELTEETDVISGGNLEDSESEDSEFEDFIESKEPLHVLPLYSLLSTEQQMKVFEAPPPGTRLCVLATNVAETSLTIPNIKYVVDCGKVKERKYGFNSNRVQSFEVGWISKASAEQRSGRAGRTGPGHCYRLYSSAVYENEFEQFTEPEINRIPIEAPLKSRLIDAEKLLVRLGALEKSSLKITEMGRKMAAFPLPPRYAKMLILGMKSNCLEYVINLVASLSTGVDPFNRDLENGIISEEEEMKRDEGEEIDGDGEKMKSLNRSQYYKAHAAFAGDAADSDALKVFNAFGAFEYYSCCKTNGTESDRNSFCSANYLRLKSMTEMSQLKGQLLGILGTMFPDKLNSKLNPALKPPSDKDRITLKQILLSGFIDQISKRDDSADPGSKFFGYSSISGSEASKMYVHPHSVLRNQSVSKNRNAPVYVIYEDLFLPQSGQRIYMKGVTEIDPKWISAIAGNGGCTFGKPLESPVPRYDRSVKSMVYSCIPTLDSCVSNVSSSSTSTSNGQNPVKWILPICERKIGILKLDLGSRQMDIFYRHFCRELLQGKVISYGPIHELSEKLTSKPTIMVKPWTQPKITELLLAVKRLQIIDCSSFLAKCKNPIHSQTLLSAFLLWVPEELHDSVKAKWTKNYNK